MSRGTQRTAATVCLIMTVIAEQKAVQDQSIWWALSVGLFAMLTVRLIMGANQDTEN